MAEVSRRSGVNIIAATGSHLAIPRVFWTATPDSIALLYIREIEVGIEGTGIRAGVIKAASDKGGVTEREEIILRAVARAHNHTGIPISTHTCLLNRVGEQQVRIFEEEGVDLNRVYIGHSNDDTNLDYLPGLLEKGVWVGWTAIQAPRCPVRPTGKSVQRSPRGWIDAEYGHRIMLSHDYSVPANKPGERGAGGATPPQPGWLPVHHTPSVATPERVGRL